MEIKTDGIQSLVLVSGGHVIDYCPLVQLFMAVHFEFPTRSLECDSRIRLENFSEQL